MPPIDNYNFNSKGQIIDKDNKFLSSFSSNFNNHSDHNMRKTLNHFKSTNNLINNIKNEIKPDMSKTMSTWNKKRDSSYKEQLEKNLGKLDIRFSKFRKRFQKACDIINEFELKDKIPVEVSYDSSDEDYVEEIKPQQESLLLTTNRNDEKKKSIISDNESFMTGKLQIKPNISIMRNSIKKLRVKKVVNDPL